MQRFTETVDAYLSIVPAEQQAAITQLRDTIRTHLPEGFEEVMQYGMIGYVVPHTRFPKGYHCDPAQPLPFVHLAAQKNYISFYHMGLYAVEGMLVWFQQSYEATVGKKPDMGKSCIRWKRNAPIPYMLIAELCGKITVEEWIRHYEQQSVRPKKERD
jgi:uncharacterized protein YdhG (YjbR/CyaY superfamily)